MLESKEKTVVAAKEKALMKSQAHFEEIFAIIEKSLPCEIESYFRKIQESKRGLSPRDGIRIYLRNMLLENDRMRDKYYVLFSDDNFSKYKTDPKDFKRTSLGKNCDIIRSTLNTQAEALFKWKSDYNCSSPEMLLKTFGNFVKFGKTYDEMVTEDIVESFADIYDNRLIEMDEKGCYQNGVIGSGIVANILGYMFPRVFPGEFKSGVLALYFMSGRDDTAREMGLPSESSEFLMVKDVRVTRTGIIEADANYNFPYFVYAMYSLKIYNLLKKALKTRFNLIFDDNDRYLLTNDFFSYVKNKNRDIMKTLYGNDDIYKYNIAC